MRGPRLVVAVVLAVLLVACGSDADDSDGSANLDDVRTEAQLADDRAGAEQALPALDDFPPGWSVEPRDDSDTEGPDLDAELAACLGVDVGLMGDAKVEAKSDTFKQDQAEVEAEVSMLPTRDYADKVVDVLNGPKARGCFEDVFTRVMKYSMEHPAEGEVLPEGVSFGDVRLDDLDFADVGEDSRAFRVSMPVRLGLLSIDLFFDIVFVRVGRAIGTLSFLDSTAPFDQELANDVADALASRLPTT